MSVRFEGSFIGVIGSAPILSANVAERLHINKGELASTLGLSADTLRRRDRERAMTTQSRLRDMIEIINRVQPWCGTVDMAFAWYRSQTLPSFGDATAADLVKDGRAQAVKDYLDRISQGGFA